MSRTEAARTIATEGAKHTLVVYFTKRTDGQPRRMVCRYAGDAIRGGCVRVWDLEKGAWRRVNLDGVAEIKVLGAAHVEHAELPAVLPTPAMREEARQRARALVADFA